MWIIKRFFIRISKIKKIIRFMVGSNDIEIANLDFHYTANKVLDQFSLSLGKGEILGLIGKNGAGKTTTIHLLLGLLHYKKGHIRVLGLDPKQSSKSILDRCGFFPEQGEPYDWMRVESLFKMGQYSFHNWDSTLCKTLSEKLELNPRKKIADLSRGMLIKAKFIFAMAHRPELLILDEPTNGLDPLSRYDIMSMIKSLSKQHNVTVLISSHNLDEIAEIATQICILDNGKNKFSYSMDMIRNSMALVEYPSGIERPQAFTDRIIRSQQLNGRTRSLIAERTAPEVVQFMSRFDGGAALTEINLKELFVFITRNWV